MKSLKQFVNESILKPRNIEYRQVKRAQIDYQKVLKYIEDGCKGDLDLESSPITTLPDKLTHVGGWFDLRNTKITQLPNNLTVNDSLDLSNTKITQLPDNLTVGGSLYLNNTKITQLPDNLAVDGSLHLHNTPILSKYETDDAIRKAFPTLKAKYIVL